MIDTEQALPFLIIVQQDETVFSLLYFVGSSTCFGCWHPTTVITATGTGQPGLLPEAVITVVRAPDDGCQHPKHVELPAEI